MFYRIYSPRGYCLKCHYYLTSYNRWVYGLVRFGSVPTLTRDCGFYKIRGRKKWTTSNCKLTQFNTWPIMHTVNFINFKIFHHAIFAHFEATTATLFCWLKNYYSLAIKISCFTQVFRCTKQHTSMTIMTTCMHSSRNF